MTVLVDFDGYTAASEFCDEECVNAANHRSADLLLGESYGLETFDSSQSQTVQLYLGAYTCDIYTVMERIKTNVPNWADFTHKEALIYPALPCWFDGIAYITELEEWLFSITKLYMEDHPGFDARWEWIRSHEFGHNYALVHGWKNGVEYADDSCIMGSGIIYSAAVRYLRGWIRNTIRTGTGAEDALVALGAGESAVVELQSLGTADPYAPGQVGALAVTAPYGDPDGWVLVFWLSPFGSVTTHKVRGLYYDHHLLDESEEGGSFTVGYDTNSKTTMSVGNITVDEDNVVLSATVTFS